MTCIRQPRQPKAVESQDAMQVSTQPQLHLMACVNHEARRLPLWFFHLVCVGGSAWHIICLPLVHSNLPKRGRSAKDCSTLLQLVLALRIWNSPPFIRHMPQPSVHHFWRNKHPIASVSSAGRLHAHIDALRSNSSQHIAPHMRSSSSKPTGRPNEDSRRTCHHNLRHGCQTKLTCLHKKQVEPKVLAAVCHIKQKTKCHPQDAVGAHMNSCYPDLCMHIHMLHISLSCYQLPIKHETYRLKFFLTYLLTYLLTFFLTYLLTYLFTFFLTYLLTFFLTYFLTFFLTYLLTVFLTNLLP